MQHLQSNFKFLREKSGLKQAQLSLSLGFSRGAWNNYETGKSKPALDDFVKISKHFGLSGTDLLEVDLRNVALNDKSGIKENTKNVALKVAPNVALSGKKEYPEHEIKITVTAEPDVNYGKNVAIIPITNINVAAGAGHFNPDHIEGVEALHMPIQLLKRNSTYLCVKIKGVSMAPTLQDGGYVIIRLVDKSKWAEIPDEHIYVVSDIHGQTFLKRVKNRFKQGFMVMRSDSPDRASYPNFNLFIEDINTIWFVEWYFSAKMPNIHDQFYSRLQVIEDRMDEIERNSL